MATVPFRPGSLLGFLMGRARPRPARGVLSPWRRWLLAVGVVVGRLLVPAGGLTSITIGAWQWSTPAGLIMLGVSLLLLDAAAGNGGPAR